MSVVNALVGECLGCADFGLACSPKLSCERLVEERASMLQLSHGRSCSAGFGFRVPFWMRERWSKDGG